MDNSWSVALNRADAAGLELANALLRRAQGGRPVTLMGYALGARVIFRCLTELAQRKQSEGIVERVLLLGLPASGAPGRSGFLCLASFVWPEGEGGKGIHLGLGCAKTGAPGCRGLDQPQARGGRYHHGGALPGRLAAQVPVSRHLCRGKRVGVGRQRLPGATGC